MVIVLAKHDGCNQDFVWSVPPWMDIHKGDVLLVDTSYGLTVATASSEIIESQDAAELAQRFGAYMPLKVVKGYCGKMLQQYIKNQALSEALQMIGDAIKPVRFRSDE